MTIRRRDPVARGGPDVKALLSSAPAGGLRRLTELLGFAPGAVIFDMDGVLADTEPVNQQALVAVLTRRGAELTELEYASLVGLSNDATWAWLIARFGLAATAPMLTDEYVQELRPRVEALRPGPGVVALIGELEAAGVPIAIASSSPRDAVDVVLATLGLRGSFGAVVSDEDVRLGKPAPDIFLLAANRLGVEAARCIVIEDSVHGVEAGNAAGMTTVALRTRYNATSPLQARLVVDSVEALL